MGAARRSDQTLADLLFDRAHHSQDDWDSALYVEAAERLGRLAGCEDRIAQAVARAENEALGDHVSIFQLSEIIGDVMRGEK